jgi:hypothetical protein
MYLVGYDSIGGGGGVMYNVLGVHIVKKKSEMRYDE